jgi:hypothetical protein
MSMSMSMSMSMATAMGAAGNSGIPLGFGATPPELGYRQLTLQFPLGPMALPGFPQEILPPQNWTWDPRNWDADLYATLTVMEIGKGWQAIAFPPALLQWQNPTTSAAALTFVTGEIKYLQDLMRQDRERYLPEILAQHDGAPLYWISLMGLTRETKPNTLQLIHAAVKIGEMAVVYFKDQMKRPRASEICPGLVPPFGPPGHPAFPSGHATQGWLISRCLKYVAPDYWPQLKWLAKRVALNRERAGFHYPSDSQGGRHLAKELFSFLITTQPPRFWQTLQDAAAEWP